MPKTKKGKKKEERVLELKVYKNKKTGQASIILPKKKMKDIPEKVKIIKW